MINKTEISRSAQSNTAPVSTEECKPGKIRVIVAMAILSIYLGSLIIAGIYQLLWFQ